MHVLIQDWHSYNYDRADEIRIGKWMVNWGELSHACTDCSDHEGKNSKMCTNAYFLRKNLNYLSYINFFIFGNQDTVVSGSKILLLTPLHVWFLYWPLMLFLQFCLLFPHKKMSTIYSIRHIGTSRLTQTCY